MVTNNFAREFLGEKNSAGTVALEEIEAWINSGEIIQAFEEWKAINDEGEEHIQDQHVHKAYSRRRGFGRAPSAFTRRARGNDL